MNTQKNKINRLVVILSLATILFSGCEKFLDEKPIANPTVEDYYKTINDLQNSLTAVYNVLRRDNFIESEWLFGEGCSDNVVRFNTVSPYHEKARLMEFNKLASNNSYILQRWEQNYAGIFRANHVIHYGPKIEDPTTGVDTMFTSRIICEAKFLRALFYFNLVKTYGGVPIKPDTLEIYVNGTDNFTQPKSSAEEVYAYIERDLRESLLGLYHQEFGKYELGKANTGAAAGLLIKVLAYQAKNGTNDPKWSEALTIADAVVNGGSLGSETLVGRYLNSAIDSINLMARLKLPSIPQNIKFPTYSLTQYDALWDYPGEFTSGSVFEINFENTHVGFDNFGSGWSDALVPVHAAAPVSKMLQPAPFLAQLKTSDYRAKVSVIDQEQQIPGGNTPGGQGGPMFLSIYKWHIHPEDKAIEWNRQGKNFKIMRFAEILLFYAEALNETGNPAAAIDVLNRLRSRDEVNPKIYYQTEWEGVNPDLDALPYGNYLEVRDNIWKERRIELMFEFDRYFDLIRTGQAEEKFKEYNTNLFNEGVITELGGEYTKHWNPYINKVFPIPFREIELSNGAVKQNPGY